MSTPRSDHMPLGFTPSSDSPASNAAAAPGGDPPPPPPTTTTAGPAGASALRSAFGLPGALNTSSKMAPASRSGAGSPSHDMAPSSRIYNKRTREIQAQESGLATNPWMGPPTSGNSTPLRENIPESPTDGFPEFAPTMPTPESLPTATRRARAGTVPSRFSPGGANAGLATMAPPPPLPPTRTPTTKQSAVPSGPYMPPTPAHDQPDSSSGPGATTFFSRLRAGSMPQRSPFNTMPGATSPFGPSIFSNWNPSGLPARDRGMTLASIASISSNGPSSPAQSAFSKEGGEPTDMHMRTLDYLGLAEPPQQQPRVQIATPYLANMNDYAKASRFRSYSVNNKDKYAEEEEDEEDDDGAGYPNVGAGGADMAYGNNIYVARLQDQLAATHAAIHNHNLAVQAYANQASVTRPRARTAGVLDTPATLLARKYFATNLPPPPPSSGGGGGGGSQVGPVEGRLSEEKEYDELPHSVAALSMGRPSNHGLLLNPDEGGLEGPTSALWLGSIPTSTTISTLNEIFKGYGIIISSRVLTHKNCGFVNYDRVESAVAARANLNGKEIFPGAGPVRINFAKPPSASNTPGPEGMFPSPSPDPFSRGGQDGSGQGAGVTGMAGGATGADKPGGGGPAASAYAAAAAAAPAIPPLAEMTEDILDIVKQFGATEEDVARTSRSLESAIRYSPATDDIPPIREPTHTRLHDAPKLRDIRKRIDNQSLTQSEIEAIAVDMLPEVAELSSDYLGNTVIQKLFEHCSDQHRDAMLAEVAPHLAEIGVHKNGTWAAQKIIDVCSTPRQMSLIVEHLRPYAVPLFLDQYGNYVLQGCLKFGAPFNDFIFEIMLSQMWEIGQGRFGARAMRACLESHHATKDQQRMLAAAIALHSVQLASNPNGALLLTWFLDTCTFPHRRTVLSPQLVPYLVQLCTHKVAYLTALKVINQKAEPDARDAVLQSLFFTPNDRVLEAILSDHACGATLIFKVLTTPFFDESIRGQVVETIRTVLVRIKAQPNQGYKRLMDEVGLSTRNSGGGGNREQQQQQVPQQQQHNPSSSSSSNNTAGSNEQQRQRPASRQASGGGNGVHHQQHQQAPQPAQGANRQLFNNNGPMAAANQANFDGSYSTARNEPAMDPSMLPFQAAFGAQPAPLPPPSHMYSSPGTPVGPPSSMPQFQYQHAMMNHSLPPINSFFPPMQAGFGSLGSPNPAADQFRSQSLGNGSPAQMAAAVQMPRGGGGGGPQSQASFGPPPGLVMNNGPPPFGYGHMGGAPPNMNYVQQQQEQGGRRGRR